MISIFSSSESNEIFIFFVPTNPFLLKASMELVSKLLNIESKSSSDILVLYLLFSSELILNFNSISLSFNNMSHPKMKDSKYSFKSTQYCPK